MLWDVSLLQDTKNYTLAWYHFVHISLSFYAGASRLDRWYQFSFWRQENVPKTRVLRLESLWNSYSRSRSLLCGLTRGLTLWLQTFWSCVSLFSGTYGQSTVAGTHVQVRTDSHSGLIVTFASPNPEWLELQEMRVQHKQLSLLSTRYCLK